MKRDRIRFGLLVAAIAAAYYVTAVVGLRLNAVHVFATLVWAPTGIALASVLMFGYRVWPAIAIGAFAANVTVGASPLLALIICGGNTLEALAGVYLLHRFGHFDRSLGRVKDVLGLVFLAAIGSTVISATIGVTGVLVTGGINASQYGTTWSAWWVGDMLGALVVAPLILVWSRWTRKDLRLRIVKSAFIPAILLVAVSLLVFLASSWFGAEPLTLKFMVFPFLIWIALRFRQRGTVTAIFVVAVMAVWGTISGYDPVGGQELSRQLLLMQIFLGVSAITYMTMAAVVAEREQTHKEEQRLQLATEQLTRQREQLIALNQAKDEFISLASHQLRTPATSVKQYIGLLTEEYAGPLTPEQRAILASAYESNERQLKVIGDLLDVAQLDTGKVKLDLKQTDLTALVNDVLKSRRSAFKNRKQTVAFPHGKSRYYVQADSEKLRIVLENILDNASKYSHPGEKLAVHVSRDEHSGEAVIAVTDNGVGIAKKDQYKLFKKISRIENPLSQAVGGNGLGLYWSKKIVLLHNGSISVDSAKGKGSTFTVRLP